MDIDYYHYQISPEEPISFPKMKNDKIMSFYNDNGVSKQESAKFFNTLNEYRFPSGGPETKSNSSNSQYSAPNSPGTSVSFQDIPQSPRTPSRTNSRRFSHRRSIHTASGSSTDSIFSDVDGSRYSSVVSGNFPKHDIFEEIMDNSDNNALEHPILYNYQKPNQSNTPHSKVAPQRTELIDLDVASKPLRPRKKSHRLQGSLVEPDYNKRKSLGGLQDETISEDDCEDGELDLLDFLRESIDEPSSTTEEKNPFECIRLNRSIEFDPTTFKY